jgi:DNA-binding beta-propeller fold protein YncE
MSKRVAVPIVRLIALLWCGSMAPVGAIEPYLDRKIEAEGVSIRVQMSPREDTGRRHGVMGEQVDLHVQVQRLADAQPMSNLPIGLWLDRQVSPMSGAVPVCGQRVASFLSGGLLSRPLLDLTGYWVLTMDREGSVSVLDPSVQFAGRSSLYASIRLGGQPFDWIRTADDALLFVALPAQREVAVIDLRTLSLKSRIAVGGEPTRLALQPDGRLLWVGYRAEAAAGKTNSGEAETPRFAQPAREGIAAIDIADGRLLHAVDLSAGHHDIAFSEDSRYVYASSRDSGIVATIETTSGEVVASTELGGRLVGLVSIPTQSHVWVVDGAQGVIHRLDRRGAQIDRIVSEPGLGPARLAPDGRHVLIVNPVQHRLEVVDTANARIVARETISGRPYDVMFSELYAYVRTLDIEQVGLFPFARLPKVDMQYIPVGASAVGAMPELPIASTMTATLDRNGAFFVSPSERTLFHYMEGMNAPDSSVRAFGHTPTAVAIVQRGLREVGRGRYATSFRLPSAGKLVLAMAAEAPRIRECIGVDIAASARERAPGIRVAWMGEESVSVATGEMVELRFRIGTADEAAATTQMHPLEKPLRGEDLVARVVPGSGGHAERWPVEAVDEGGEYHIRGTLIEPGGYYVHIESRSPAVQIDAMNVPATVVVATAPASSGETE